MKTIPDFSVNRCVVLTCDSIQVAQNHICIRKMNICVLGGGHLADQTFKFEFAPCRQYDDIEERYQDSFDYAKTYLHGLSYNPSNDFLMFNCPDAVDKMNEIMGWNFRDIILYKGGKVERQLAYDLGLYCCDLEQFMKSNLTTTCVIDLEDGQQQNDQREQEDRLDKMSLIKQFIMLHPQSLTFLQCTNTSIL